MKLSGSLGRVFALAMLSSFAATGCGDDGINHLPDGPPSNPTDAPPTPKPAVLKLSQDSADFGSVVTGDTSPETKLTVANIGEGPSGPITAVISGASGSNYSVTSDCTTLAPAATCTVSVKFAPTSVGTKAANVEVGGNPGGTVIASLSGMGIMAGQLRIMPSSNQFSTTTVGATSSSFTFTVSNTGSTASGTLSTVASGADVSAFSRVSDSCNGQTLAAAATCTVVVAFKPTASGPKFATFAVSGLPGGTVFASVNGFAVNDAQLFLNPTSQNFGSVVTGSTSPDAVFNLVNIGGVSTAMITQSLTGTGAASYAIASSTCSGATLAPGASCQVTLHFAPTASGASPAALAFSSIPGGTQTASLTGTGAEPGQITIAPSVKQFGNISVGQLSATQDFKVTNSGGSPTGQLNVNLVGSDASQFFVTANNCQGQSLAANGSCTVTARFQPSAAGTHAATLNVTGTPGGLASAALSGNGIPPAALSISPTLHDFGSVAVGDVTGVQTFTVTNVGGGNTGVPSAVLGGPNANQFTMTSNCPQALAPLGTCTVSVRFSPTVVGSDIGSLTVSASPGSAVTANLFGQGVTAAALSASPSSIGFGIVAIGDTSPQNCSNDDPPVCSDPSFILTNNGQSTTGTIALSLTGTNAADFGITSTNCTVLAAGESCVVSVHFKPTVKGDLTASLQVKATPGGTLGVALSGQGRPRLEILGGYYDERGFSSVDATYDFGDTTVFTYDEPYLELLLRNNTQQDQYLETLGTDVSTFDAYDENADWVEDYNSCDDYCDFFPDAFTSSYCVGLKSAKHNAKHSAKHAAKLAQNRAKLAKLPAAIRTTLEARAKQKYAAKTKTALGGGYGDDGYIYGNGGTCYVEFYFRPQSAGPKTGNIQFSIGPTTFDQANQGLIGVGVDALFWSTTANGDHPITAYDFGNVAQNQSSTQQPLYLVNRYDAPWTGQVTISPVTQGPFVYDTENCDLYNYYYGGIPSGSSCAVYTTFQPTTLGPSSELIQATVPAGTLGGNPRLELDGTGVDPSLLIINPTPVVFGNQVRGTFPVISVVVKNLAGSPTSGPLYYTLQNDNCSGGSGSGSGSGFFGPGVSGSGSGFMGNTCFQILNDGSPGDCEYGAPVANGTECNIRVQFITTNGPVGWNALSTMIIDASPGISGGETSFSVNGTVSSAIIATPASPLSFGQVDVGVQATKSFSITNISAADVTIAAMSLPIVPASTFTLNDSCSGTTVAAGASCNVSVTYQPFASGFTSQTWTWRTTDKNGSLPYTAQGTGHQNQTSFH